MAILPTSRCDTPALRVLALVVAVLLLTAPVSQAHVGTPSHPSVEETLPEGVWPLEPEPSVLAHFDPPEETWAAGHRGVDLAGAPGQVVRSALGGEVGFVGSIAGKPVVTVLHGGVRTTYEPVVATVERGRRVEAGDAIGRLVVPASHCFPAACLHWGLRRDKEYLDPLLLVGGTAVRLLPLWREDPVAATDAWVPLLRAWRPPLVVRPEGAPVCMRAGGDRW